MAQPETRGEAAQTLSELKEPYPVDHVVCLASNHFTD
jgi:hypothetical protein